MIPHVRPVTAALLTALLFGGCTLSMNRIYTERPEEILLFRGEEGREESYRIKHHPGQGKVLLVVTTKKGVDRPDPGLTLVEVDKELARRKDLVPFRGLYVKAVEEGGAADKAGILPGDLLVKAAGQDLLYSEQWRDLLRRNVPPEKPIPVMVLRGFEKQVVAATLVPGRRREIIPSSRTVPLGTLDGQPHPHAGFVPATMPAEWTERIYGEKRTTVVIGGVVVGSPAYLAGIRPGDRVVSADGRPLADAGELAARVREKVRAGEDLPIQVFHRKGGLHRATVELEDYTDHAQVQVPLLFRYEDKERGTEWSTGPFGWIAGYRGHYRRRTTREASYSRRFSCILDLVSVSWTEEESRVRLLWFIKFSSR